MAEIKTLGPRAAVDLIRSYPGIDFARILNMQNAQGLTGLEILQMAYAAIGGVNEALRDKYSAILYITDEPMVEYRQGEGVRRKTPVKAEGAIADGVRAAMTGHMLRMRLHEDVLEWTKHFLKKARRATVEADIQLVCESWENRFEDDLWTRILTNLENPVGAGWEVGWAIGTGTNVDYIPAPHSGTSFTSSHTHYLFKNGNNAAAVKGLADDQAKELRHHGITGDLDLFVSGDDVELYQGASTFVGLQPTNFIILPGTSAAAQIQVTPGIPTGMPGDIFGYLNTTRGRVTLRYNSRIPTGYSFMTRSYGNNNPNNGVALYIEPGETFGLIPNPVLTRTAIPEMEFIQLEAEHGVGVWKRLNGVAGFFGTGAVAYVNPTIA